MHHERSAKQKARELLDMMHTTELAASRELTSEKKDLELLDVTESVAPCKLSAVQQELIDLLESMNS